MAAVRRRLAGIDWLRREWFSISARRSNAKMTVETASDIAREPRDGLNGSKGTKARRFAVHELPIPGAADSLRRALRIAPHRLPGPPFPRHPEKSGDVEPDPKPGNCYNASRAIRWVLKQAVRWFHGITGSFED
jgi:hypothetical protein